MPGVVLCCQIVAGLVKIFPASIILNHLDTVAGGDDFLAVKFVDSSRLT